MSEYSSPEARHPLTSDKRVSTHAAAVHGNQGAVRPDGLQAACDHCESLERQIHDPTAELRDANERLQREIAERQRVEAELQETRRQLESLIRESAERRQIEESLRDSEAMLRAAIDHAPFEFWIRDRDGRAIMQNAQSLRHWSDHTGKRPEDTGLSEEVVTRWQANNRRAYASEVVRDEVEYECGSETRRFQSVIAPFFVETEIRGILGFNFDITELRKTEESLRESEQRQRAILDTIPDPAWLRDTDGRFLAVNSALCEFFGLAEPGILGKTVFDFLPQEAANRSRQGDLDVIRSGRQLQTEEMQLRHDATPCWFETVKRPLRDAVGNVVGIVGIARDITARKQAEEALRRHRDLVARIAETSPAGIVMVNREGQITYANPGAENLLALTKDKNTGGCYNPPEWKVTHYDGTLIPEGQYPFRQLTRLTRPEFNVHRAIVWPDGRRRLLSITAAPLFDETGQADGIVASVVDNTEQVRAENHLRESERKYRMLFENMTAAFALHEMVYDEQGKPLDYRYLEVNPAFERLTGVPIETVLGKTVKEVMPGTEQYWIDFFGTVARTGVPAAYQNFASELNRYYDVWAFSPAKDQFAVVFIDITERMRAEEVLRESEERHRTILHTAMDGFVLLGRETRLLEVNEAYCRMIGYSAQELLSMRICDLETIETEEVTAAHIQRIVARGQDRFETRHRRKDGSIIDVEVSAQCQPGGFERLVVFIRDITDRKRADESLKKSEREKAAILDGLKDVTVEYLDPEMRIIWRNNATLGASGCSSAEMCGKFCYEVARKRSEPCPDCMALKAIQTGRSQEGEVTMPDGRALLVRSNPIRDTKDQVVGVVHAAMDITAHKRAAEKLEQMQVQLAHVARLSTVGELAAEVVHELSQPLYAILNYAKASRNLLAAGDMPDLEAFRASNEKIERIATGASAICKRLRTFSRRAESERSICDVNEILTESIVLVAFEARRRKVLVETALSRIPLMISATRVEIQQVLVNLLHNALEAIEGVSDRPPQVTVQTKVANRCVEIVVSDNGVGLPTNDDRNIFEPFVTTKPDGLGMGLAISSTIVENHGGRLWATPNPEGGASFHCSLPLREKDHIHVN